MRKWRSRSKGKSNFQVGQHHGYLDCLSIGIWSAALNGDLGRVRYLIQKAADPSQPDSAGYTALVSWEWHRSKRDWGLPLPSLSFFSLSAAFLF